MGWTYQWADWGGSSNKGGANPWSTQNDFPVSYDFTYQDVVVASGSIGFLWIAKDNASTTDGNTSEVTSITDSVGNTFTKLREFCNGQGGANAGVTVSLWYTRTTATIHGNGDYLTITFSTNPTARAFSFNWWTPGAGQDTLTVAGAVDQATDAGTLPSMTLSGLPGSTEYMFIRVSAIEYTPSIGSPTTTTTPQAWKAYGSEPGYLATYGTSGGSSTSNVTLVMEYYIGTVTSATSAPTGMTQNADIASMLVAVKLSSSSVSAQANGTTLTATASQIIPVGVAHGPLGQVLFTTQTSLIRGGAAGNHATLNGVSLSAASSLLSGWAVASGTIVHGGSLPLRLYFSGGATNQLPYMSLGGFPSLQPMGAVTVQTFAIVGTPQITGVTIVEGGSNPVGASVGTLTYTPSNGRLKWQNNPTGGYNYAVLGSDGYYYVGTLESGYIVVRIVTGLLPSTEKVDTVTVATYLGDLFDDVDYSQWSAGCVEYRGLWLKNVTPNTLTNVVLSLEQPAIGSVAMGFEITPMALSGTLAQAAMHAAGVSPLSRFGAWFDTAGASSVTNTLFSYHKNSFAFKFAVPYVPMSEYYLSNGVSSSMSVLANEADSTNLLAGLSWVTTKAVGSIPRDMFIPLWIRRTIPPGTPGATVSNTFRFKLSYM